MVFLIEKMQPLVCWKDYIINIYIVLYSLLSMLYVSEYIFRKVSEENSQESQTVLRLATILSNKRLLSNSS